VPIVPIRQSAGGKFLVAERQHLLQCGNVSAENEWDLSIFLRAQSVAALAVRLLIAENSRITSFA
jgi:hypothetical protein